jgi:hypothetical protein
MERQHKYGSLDLSSNSIKFVSKSKPFGFESEVRRQIIFEVPRANTGGRAPALDDYSFIGRNFDDPALKDRSRNCTSEGDRLNRISVSLLAEAATRLHFAFAFVLQVKEFFYR